MKSKKGIIYVALAFAIVVSVSAIFLFPQGSYVHVVAEVNTDDVTIDQCALKKLYGLSVIDPEDTVSQGDRTIVLKIFYNQTELFASERNVRSNIGVGNCVLNSKTLPLELPTNVELIVQVELYNMNDQLIDTEQYSLVYQ